MIFKTKPYKHQEEAVSRFHDKEYGALFLEQGLGKSKILLDIIANSDTRNVLILAPNGLHANWHYKEITEHLPDSENWDSWYWKGPPAARSNNYWRLAEFVKNGDPYSRKFLLMNIEAVRTPKGFDYAQGFLRSHRNTMVAIDESTCIKNPKAQVTKACFKLAALADRRFILTGTPMTQGPLDLFSQCKFLHPTCTPYRTYTSFKTSFAVEEVRNMGPRSFRVVTGYRNLDRLTEALKPFSLRLTKEECLDLPDKVWSKTFTELSKEQKRAYAELKENALTLMANEEVVSSTIPLTTIMKLQQICSGFLTDDEGGVHPLPNQKLPALLQIAETTKPLVIFCAFRENVTQITKALEREHGEGSVVQYVGGMNNEARNEAKNKFQSGEASFIVCTSAGAKGLTLTRASTMVYFSNTYMLEARLQSQDRIHRIGQDKTCNYIDLVCPNTIDEAILEALNNKKDLSDMVLEDLIALVKRI